MTASHSSSNLTDTSPKSIVDTKGVTSGQHIYLIDGSGFIFRAFHALPPLSRADGTPVGAVLGFCNIILKLLDSHEIDNIAVVFDSARANFRHDIYPEYKANRGETPEDLIPQFPLFREACTAFDIPQIELEGYEADDIIATYTKRAVQQGNDVTIVSSDKDLMQLVGPGVRMLDPIKNKFIGPEDVLEKFGVSPDKVIDIQSLAGDSTDNIPGVPGIGIKTAALLINQYGDLDTLLARAEDITQTKRRENLIEFADQARISRDLVTLAVDAPIELRLADLALKNPDSGRLHRFLQEQGFTNLIGRLIRRGMIHPDDDAALSSPDALLKEDLCSEIAANLKKIDKSYDLVTTLEKLKSVLHECEQSGVFAFDTETTDLNPSRAQLVGVSLCAEPGKAYYIPLGHVDGQTQQRLADQIDLNEALSLLRPVLQNPGNRVIGQNLKYDMRILLNYGVEIACYDDTMVMSYAVFGATQSHALDEQALKYFTHDMVKYKDVMDQLKKDQGLKTPNFSHVPLEKARDYAAEDADYTLRLYHVLKQKLIDASCQSLYHDLDLPMVKVLALMEHKGIHVCADELKKLSIEFDAHIQSLAKAIYGIAGREFNIGSPKQMGDVLFDDMGLDGGKKGKAGSYSTGADILEKLAADGHEIAEKILSWRHYSKLKSTYTEALQNEIRKGTGRVHTTYGLTSTTTGRLSSSDPNLQNIPIRTEDGRKIRRAFVAKEGYKLLALDYSQIELRLLAHVAGMDSLKTAFQNGQDIHAMTASEMFDVPLDKVDALTRRSAKAINFGIIYGISPFGLSRQLNISRGDAKAYIDKYFEKYPGIRRYMEAQKDIARKNGYIETLMGRRCMISGMNDSNPMRRAFAERQAINAPLQGSSADIIKKAMITMGDIFASVNDANAMVTQPNMSKVEPDVGISAASNTVQQMDLFGGVMPAGVSLGMPKPQQPSQTETSAINSHSTMTTDRTFAACPIVGPYGANQNLIIGDKLRLLLQVHDELIFEVHEDVIDDVTPKLQKHMETVIRLDVPLIVDAGIGMSWDEAH